MWSELEGWTELYDVAELAALSRTTTGRASSGSSPRRSTLRDELREARTAAASA